MSVWLDFENWAPINEVYCSLTTWISFDQYNLALSLFAYNRQTNLAQDGAQGFTQKIDTEIRTLIITQKLIKLLKVLAYRNFFYFFEIR